MNMRTIVHVGLVALALLGLVPGCYTTKIEYGGRDYDGTGERHRVVVNNILWGLESVGEVNADEYCLPKDTEIAEIRSRITFLGAVIRTFTFGFYTPIVVRITCTPAPTMVGVDPDTDPVPRAPAVSYELVPVDAEPSTDQSEPMASPNAAPVDPPPPSDATPADPADE